MSNESEPSLGINTTPHDRDLFTLASHLGWSPSDQERLKSIYGPALRFDAQPRPARPTAQHSRRDTP